MKKFLLPLAAFILTSQIAFSQESLKPNSEQKKAERKLKSAEEENDVDPKTKESFNADFPNATNVMFSRGKDVDQVNFVSNKQDTLTAYYIGGQLTGTTQERKLTDIPPSAQKTILTDYKEYKILRVFFFDDNEENWDHIVLYEEALPQTDAYFIIAKKGDKQIILKSSLQGDVSVFKNK